MRLAYIGGIFFGYGYFIRYALMGGLFYIGTLLIMHKGLDPEGTYMAIFILYMSTVGAGIHLSNAPSVSRA